MAKIYFRHGVVSSAKTLNLLAVAHSYEVQGKTVLVIKPAMDTRFGEDIVRSRTGLDRKADILVSEDTRFDADAFDGTDCVLVDEAQFLAPSVIEQLRHVASMKGVPVICYGLRTDFRSRLFPGSQRLMELADVIEEVKTTCSFCNRRAILNLKSVDGKPTLSGPSVALGCEELYVPACYAHFIEKVEEATGEAIDFAKAAAAGALADEEQRKSAVAADAVKDDCCAKEKIDVIDRDQELGASPMKTHKKADNLATA
jgi:thymidine kinase